MGHFIQDFRADQILRYAFHGFVYDKQVNQVLCNLSLCEYDSRDLIGRLHDEVTYEEYCQVTEKYDRAFLGIPSNELSVSQIKSGGIVTLIGEFDYRLRLFHVDKSLFICITDSSEVLQYGDSLYILDLGFKQGERILLSVLRGGKPYPDEKKVFQSPVITQLYLLQEAQINNRDSHLPEPVKPNQVVYAYSFRLRDNMAFLSEDNLTLDKTAIIQVNLTTMQFTLNSAYSRASYERAGISILDDVLKPVSYISGTDITNVASCRAGILSYDSVMNGLKVDQKMSLVLGN